ncbi:unnamed protein product [Trichogramma brassicae]|uniref:Uncharacterized protein n=1 Tax=Trichogramma brassicae TaxID=86971 RepID=A0A6H5IKX8_9HYME|nr:unnamed protein product [Trichogramma brassicae]
MSVASAWHAVAASCPASPSCTSPLVGRRDPLGVGQRPGRLTVAQLSRVLAPRTAGVSRPDCPTVEIFVNKVLGRVLLSASRLVDRLASLGFTDLVPLPGAWLAVKSAMSSDWLLDYLSATLLLWVLSGPVLKNTDQGV